MQVTKEHLVPVDKIEEWQHVEISDRHWPLTMDKPVETMTHQFPQIRSGKEEYSIVTGNCDMCERCKDDPQYCEVCTAYHFNETWMRNK